MSRGRAAGVARAVDHDFDELGFDGVPLDLVAVAGVGADGGGVGPVSSTSVSLGGASTSFAVAPIPVGVQVDPLDGRTPYGAIALALRACIPTATTGT